MGRALLGFVLVAVTLAVYAPVTRHPFIHIDDYGYVVNNLHIQHLDWSKIATRDNFLPGAAIDCAMGLDVYGDVLAYNTSVTKDGPPSLLAPLWRLCVAMRLV